MAFAGRHSILSMAFVGLTLAIIAYEVSNLTRNYSLLGPAELTGRSNRENALVVDLRPYADYSKGHIAGSKNVGAHSWISCERTAQRRRSRN